MFSTRDRGDAGGGPQRTAVRKSVNSRGWTCTTIRTQEPVDVERHGDVGDVDAVELQVEGEGLAEEVARLHLEDVPASGAVEGAPPPLEEFALRHECFIAA